MLQSGGSAPKPASANISREEKKIEPLSMQSVPKALPNKQMESSKQKTDMHLNRAEDLLKEVMREEKSGFKLDSDKKAQPSALDKKPTEDDAYEEDFDEIEEDLPDGHNDDAYDQDAVGRSANVAGSG